MATGHGGLDRDPSAQDLEALGRDFKSDVTVHSSAVIPACLAIDSPLSLDLQSSSDSGKYSDDNLTNLSTPITDLAGNQMDQDGDGAVGDPPGDKFLFSFMADEGERSFWEGFEDPDPGWEVDNGVWEFGAPTASHLSRSASVSLPLSA